MSFSEGEDEREDSSSPPARRAILTTRDHFCLAWDVVRLMPGRGFGSGPVPFSMGGFLEERGRGVVRARYWASFTAFGEEC